MTVLLSGCSEDEEVAIGSCFLWFLEGVHYREVRGVTTRKRQSSLVTPTAVKVGPEKLSESTYECVVSVRVGREESTM
jgi:hypothetical protein